MFCRDSQYFRRIASNIKRKYGTEGRLESQVTFREFVQHIIDPQTRRTLERHWQPIYELCQPCRIHYDFIGHHETLADDSRYVLSRLANLSDDLQFPQPKAVHNSSSRLTDVFAQLTQDEVDRLEEVYRLDFLLFGYSAIITS